MNRLLSIFCRILISGYLVSTAVNAASPNNPIAIAFIDADQTSNEVAEGFCALFDS
ncbi:hypothetical protein GF337_09860, partial [candidate division KSB1 bacterium]|nr:hypothetical protein [candidate division KSB1 bacterium]